MAFRLRTRVTFTIEFIVALTIILMAGIFIVLNVQQLAGLYYERGRMLNAIAQNHIEYGMALPQRAARLAGEQAVLSAVLAAELVRTAERDLDMNADEVSALLGDVIDWRASLYEDAGVEILHLYDKYGRRYAGTGPELDEDSPTAHDVLDRMSDDSPRIVEMRSDPENPGVMQVAVSLPDEAAPRVIELHTSAALSDNIRDAFSIEDIMTQFLLHADVDRIAIVREDGTVEAEAGESLLPGEPIADADVVRFCVTHLNRHRRALPGSRPPFADFLPIESLEGSEALGVVTPLGSTDGIRRALFIQHETTETTEVINDAITSIITVGLIMFFLAAIAGILLSGRLARPLVHLAEGAEVIAKGNFSYRVAEQGYKEVRTLARAFNQMVDSIQRYTLQLKNEAQIRERLESDLRIGAEIQQALLPTSPPEVAGLDVAGWSRSARQVGGDFYDLIRLDDNGMAIELGDASGKGIPAALIITECSSTIRALIGERYALGSLVAKTNRALVPKLSESAHFVTLFMAEVDVEKGVLAWTTAGHNPPLIIPANGGATWLRGEGGIPLGIESDAQFSDHRRPFNEGDILLAYSDGITECRDAAGNFYTCERLLELASQHRNLSARKLIDAIRDDHRAFRGEKEQDDDMTLLVVRRTKTA